MCLAIPGRIIEIHGHTAKVDFKGLIKEVDISLLEDVKVGDYVVVHVGFAISTLDKKEAEETLKLWDEILSKIGGI